MSAMKAKGIAVAMAFACVALDCVAFDCDASGARARETEWLKDWSENIRTNANIETCASFRDTRLRPFVLAEMDPDGKASEDERRIMLASIDHVWGVGGFKTFKDAKKLVEILNRTAKKPFAEMVAAFVRKQNSLAVEVVAWLESGKFSDEDLRAAFWTLWRNVNFGSENMMNAMEKADVDEWLKLLWRIGVERSTAWKSRGGGWAKYVTEEGWAGFENHGDACRAAFERAMELHPFPEPAYQRSKLGPFGDDAFVAVTTAQADQIGFFDDFLWYNCYPRWCGSHRKMKAFAVRCYETQRHDTMVPYFYAEAILRMAKDMEVRLEDYFADHPDELDRILEVSLPQIASYKAFGTVRQNAGAFATLAYYLKGDYAKAADTWRSFWHGTMPKRIWSIVDNFSRWWMLFDGISGKNRVDFQRLNALYVAGDYDGFVKGLDELRGKGVKFDGGERTFAEELGLSALIKRDFASGKPVVATFPKSKSNWLTYGGSWRMNGEYAFYDGKYKSGDPLEWAPEFPGDFRLECVAAPNGDKKSWHLEFTFKPSDPALADSEGRPYLSLTFADGKCNAAFGVWRDIYKNDCAKKASTDYAGGNVRLVVTYSAGKASVVVGDDETPVLETEAFSDFLKLTAAGRVRFNGSGARILSLKVSSVPERTASPSDDDHSSVLPKKPL